MSLVEIAYLEICTLLFYVKRLAFKPKTYQNREKKYPIISSYSYGITQLKKRCDHLREPLTVQDQTFEETTISLTEAQICQNAMFSFIYSFRSQSLKLFITFNFHSFLSFLNFDCFSNHTLWPYLFASSYITLSF